MNTRPQYEMSELVTQEVPVEDMDYGDVTNPFHANGDLASENWDFESARDGSSPVNILRKRKSGLVQKTVSTASTLESMDFEEVESRQWRKHQLRRFVQDKGKRFSASRMTTAWKWALLVAIALVVACIGGLGTVLIRSLVSWKFSVVYEYMAQNKIASAFFAYQFMSLFFASIAYLACYLEPAVTGSGIPEICAFLNGVNLNNFVKLRLVIGKFVSMCFSVASGLPTGKKGPMIHIGATMAAVISQGGRRLMGFDASWQRFQDFRNDKSKRDFVTCGLAAGVTVVFRSPIGGCLFALETGASFWSSTLTFRAFFCAMLSLFTIQLLFFTDSSFGRSEVNGLFVFGQFQDYNRNLTNYNSYELFVFILMGITGGLIGAAWNHLATAVIKYYMSHMVTLRLKAVRLALTVIAMCSLSFLFSLAWNECSRKPTEEEMTNWEEADKKLLDELVQFHCPDGTYNQVASLYFTTADTAIRQLFHFREYAGESHPTFDTGPLLLFFIPYFAMASSVGGLMLATGVFGPSLLAGAAYGRIWGHVLHSLFPGSVADAGSYALIGAAAINGGVTRMTISMTIIMLETSGNMTYLLPLMVTFATARYTGNAFNMGMHDVQMQLKNLPYLESSLHTLGLLNYNAVTEIMATPVVTMSEIDKVSTIVEILKKTSHNGFPVVDINGKLRGLVLRKTLTSLLNLKGFSAPEAQHKGRFERRSSVADMLPPGALPLAAPAATIFYETIEKQYPDYPSVTSIKLSEDETSLWLDLRPYMDTSCYMISATASILRTHREFRTMGMRHLVVLDGDHAVVGMITRKDILEKRLRSHWQKEGLELEQNINVEAVPPGIIYDFTKPALPRSDILSLREFSDNEGEDEVENDTFYKRTFRKASVSSRTDKVNSLRRRAEDNSNFSDSEVYFNTRRGSESHVDQSAEFWQNLGISRGKKNSVSQISHDDFCEDDDHLEAASDAPDLDFQDRSYRRNSSVSVMSEERRPPSTYDSIRQGKWRGLRIPKP